MLRNSKTKMNIESESGEYENKRRWFEGYVARSDSGVIRPARDDFQYVCPCCGYPTLPERGGYDICCLCGWEDDGQDDPHAGEVWGGPNGRYSLTEARENFKRYWIKFSPGNDTRLVSGDTAVDLEAKKAIVTAFDAMGAADEAEQGRLWEIVKQGKRPFMWNCSAKLKNGNSVSGTRLLAIDSQQSRLKSMFQAGRNSQRMVRMLGDEQWAQGCRLLDEGYSDEAVAVWREALRLNPNHADARYNIGVVLSQTGHTDDAMAEWRETVRRNPNFWQAHENLGYVFLKRARKKNRRRDWQAARDAFRRVRAVRPDDVQLLHMISVMEWRLGNKKAALATLKEAVKLDPMREDLLYRLGDWQMRMGHWRGLWQTGTALCSLPTYDPANYPIRPASVFLRIVLPITVFVILIVFIVRWKRD